MECYDCGGEFAAGFGKCPACGCPSAPEEALKYLEARQLSAKLESDSAPRHLGRARSAMFAAALLSLAGGAIELVNAQGDVVSLAVGVLMLLLAGGYVAAACNIRRSPLTFSVAGLVAGLPLMRGMFGPAIVGILALSVWFAVQYVKITRRERTLQLKIDKLK